MSWQQEHRALERLFKRNGLVEHQVKVLQEAELSVASRSGQLVGGFMLVSDCFQDRSLERTRQNAPSRTSSTFLSSLSSWLRSGLWGRATTCFGRATLRRRSAQFAG
jgi:hypothetical protein